MTIKEQITRRSDNIIHEEIISISKGMDLESNQEIIENAKKIASDFLKKNSFTEPITLARASFFVAMKSACGSLKPTEKTIKLLIHNNGNANRWWIYLVPLVEKHTKRR